MRKIAYLSPAFISIEGKMRDKKILLIDPNFETVRSLCKFLTNMTNVKIEVSIAYDGEDGLKKVKSENPDLIILDPMLPKLNGLDLCNIIARDFEKKIPVIILSRFYSDFKEEILKSFGAAAYLNKPFEKEELYYTIIDLLKERKKGDDEKGIPTVKKNAKKPVKKNEGNSPAVVRGDGNNGKGSGHSERQLPVFLSLSTDDNGIKGEMGWNYGEIDRLIKNVLFELETHPEKKGPSQHKHEKLFFYKRL